MKRSDLVSYAIKKGVTDRHEAETIAHNTLMKESAKGVEFSEVRFRSLDYHKRKAREAERFVSLETPESTDDTPLVEILEYDNENEIVAAQKDSQRQLIKDLVSGSDERTIEIVRTWLDSDKPNITSIGKQLGMNHRTVARCLQRLAKNFDQEKYGDITEYLTS